MARILHMADMHLDSAFTSRLSSEKAQLRRSEQRAVFSRIIDLAHDRADVLLISGDLFDGANISPETISFIKRKFAEIEDIPIYIAAGNHDPYSDDSVYSRESLGDNVHIFSANGGYYDIDSLKLRLCGASFACEDGSNMPKLSELEKRDGYTNIAVIHGDVSYSEADGGRYNPISYAEIENSGFDYVALGHIHVSDGVHKRGGTYWSYPGIPEPRGFDECSERGSLGVIYFETSERGAEFEQIDVHERLCHVLNIELSEDIADSERVIELITAKLAEYSDKDLFKIILSGWTQMGFRPNIDMIAERVKGLKFYIRISDETEVMCDLTVDEGDCSLRAEYIRMMNERILSAADDEEKRIAEMALIIGVNAIDGRL